MKTDIEFFELGQSKKGDEKIKEWWKDHNEKIVKWEVINGSVGGSSKLIVEYQI